jgi:ornithine cyclodeaminase/alanine dehydrogenase-like protein (mu-crystallin family)
VKVRVLLESEIRDIIGPPEALRSVRQGFLKLARGEASLPGVIGFRLPGGGEVHVKGAHLHGSRYFCVKEAGGFPGNAARGLPTSNGMVQAFDAQTGELRGLLFDNGYLTDLRTAAAGALAADVLARPGVVQAGILGTGTQARYQLDALLGVRQPGRVVVWGRNEEKARAFARELASRYNWLPVEVVRNVYQATEGSEVVVTVTAATAPLVREDWVFKGTHITAVGSDAPDKCELMGQVLAKADKVVADRLDQCLALGEIHHAVEGGYMTAADVHGELGELLDGRKPGRETDDEITVADLTGVGVQDAAVADFVMEEAERQELGTYLEVLTPALGR